MSSANLNKTFHLGKIFSKNKKQQSDHLSTMTFQIVGTVAFLSGCDFETAGLHQFTLEDARYRYSQLLKNGYVPYNSGPMNSWFPAG